MLVAFQRHGVAIGRRCKSPVCWGDWRAAALSWAQAPPCRSNEELIAFAVLLGDCLPNPTRVQNRNGEKSRSENKLYPRS